MYQFKWTHWKSYHDIAAIKYLLIGDTDLNTNSSSWEKENFADCKKNQKLLMWPACTVNQAMDLITNLQYSYSWLHNTMYRKV